MTTKDELYAEIERLNAEIRELKEHLIMCYVDNENDCLSLAIAAKGAIDSLSDMWND